MLLLLANTNSPALENVSAGTDVLKILSPFWHFINYVMVSVSEKTASGINESIISMVLLLLVLYCASLAQ